MSDSHLERAWEVWAAENLLRGKDPAAVHERLVKEGVPTTDATALLDGIRSSPVFEAAAQMARDARRWSAVATLHERLRRDATHPHDIPRETALSAERFYDVYYAASSPVLIEGLVARAFDPPRWSPAGLAERFGDVELEATVDRENTPGYERTFRRRSQRIRLASLVEHLERSRDAPRNDVYVVAQNRVLEQTALRALLDDIHFPPGWLDDTRLRRDGASLWLGPAGTRTPLHHDHNNLLVCQLYGRKRWRLVPPTDRALLARVDAPYTTIDVAELSDALVKDVIVEPGEALFVPAGWWHQVESLEPSTTLSIAALARDNEFALRDLTRRW